MADPLFPMARPLLGLTALALSACGGASMPGVSIAEDDDVRELQLNGPLCHGHDEGTALQWTEVQGVELVGTHVLLVRLRHAACERATFRACASGEIIETYPGTWEVRVEAQVPESPEGPTPSGCGEPRTSVLRIELDSPELPREGVTRVRGVHELPSQGTRERTTADRRGEPRVWAIDLEVAD